MIGRLKRSPMERCVRVEGRDRGSRKLLGRNRWVREGGENESLVEAAIKDEMGERGREEGYRLVEVSVTILESEEVEGEEGEG